MADPPDTERPLPWTVRASGVLAGTLQRWSSLATRWRWLLPGLVAGVVVAAGYLQGHDYPAFGAGLFLSMAEHAVATFPALPDTIPHYTADGVPFAYPPLLLWVTGFLLAADVSPFAVTTAVPLVASVLALVPLYCFAEELLGSPRGAGLATVLAATAPPLLQWQISAGGVVRAPAYLFTMVGLYAGLRLFADRERRWLAPSTAAFALTTLSHPVYAAFFVLSYLVMFGAYDRTPRGLGRGAVVGVGGVVLASPWWGQVVAVHGFEVLAGAAGTHGGVGQQLPDLLALVAAPGGGRSRAALFAVEPGLFDFATPGMALVAAWSLVVVGSWVVLLWARRGVSFLTAWAPLAVVFVSRPRFLLLIGAIMAGAVLDRHVMAAVARVGGRRAGAAQVATGVLLFGAAAGTGALYAGGHLNAHAGNASQPAFVDDHDLAAMDWVSTTTEGDADFVVLGDAAEWFPYLTDRTILVGPWGVEWRGTAAYRTELRAFDRISTCRTAGCLTRRLYDRGLQPDYVYVPRGQYVRGMAVVEPGELESGLSASPSYRLVHENPGVAIYEFGGHPDEPVRSADRRAGDPGRRRSVFARGRRPSPAELPPAGEPNR